MFLGLKNIVIYLELNNLHQLTRMAVYLLPVMNLNLNYEPVTEMPQRSPSEIAEPQGFWATEITNIMWHNSGSLPSAGLSKLFSRLLDLRKF